MNVEKMVSLYNLYLHSFHRSVNSSISLPSFFHFHSSFSSFHSLFFLLSFLFLHLSVLSTLHPSSFQFSFIQSFHLYILSFIPSIFPSFQSFLPATSLLISNPLFLIHSSFSSFRSLSFHFFSPFSFNPSNLSILPIFPSVKPSVLQAISVLLHSILPSLYFPSNPFIFLILPSLHPFFLQSVYNFIFFHPFRYLSFNPSIFTFFLLFLLSLHPSNSSFLQYLFLLSNLPSFNSLFYQSFHYLSFLISFLVLSILPSFRPSNPSVFKTSRPSLLQYVYIFFLHSFLLLLDFTK
ncbi:unnamed protein product [Acanthosepion pharaonis]|uniref:Uncharacterized protein n=1 Tax=Acanthosepion pharaonis TaxID=158019 RepID=A0A812B5U5_ACAPH|nr:unnamed protein product [Sepia pharaonis]